MPVMLGGRLREFQLPWMSLKIESSPTGKIIY